ncbi:MAG: sulfite exporter TauE/SafE family protein [Acidimicrobiia bacterium]
MLASINPLGERSRNSRFAITLTAYLAGSVAGGAAAGSLLGLVGAGLHAIAPWSTAAAAGAVVVAVVVALVLDAGVAGLRVPTFRRQVNEDMLHEYREWVYGSSFGFQLGLGVVTIVTTSTVYLTFALAALTGAWQAGLLIGAIFGFVRALPMLLVARVYDPDQLRRLFRRINGWAPVAQRGSFALLAVAGSVAVVAIWTGAPLG